MHSCVLSIILRVAHISTTLTRVCRPPRVGIKWCLTFLFSQRGLSFLYFVSLKAASHDLWFITEILFFSRYSFVVSFIGFDSVIARMCT